MTAPVRHPSWCDRRHADSTGAHTVQVGVDLQLSENLSYSVELLQAGDEPTRVVLYRHTDDASIADRLSIVQASILRDLLGEGLKLIDRNAGFRL